MISSILRTVLLLSKKNLPKVQTKLTNVLEIQKTFKDFSYVVNYHNKLFVKNNFERNIFLLLDECNKKRLYRLNIVMKTYMNYSDKVGKEIADVEFSKVLIMIKVDEVLIGV